MASRCLWCGKPEKVHRVDKSKRRSERGLGVEGCDTEGCRNYHGKDEMAYARRSRGREMVELVSGNMRCGRDRWTDRCSHHRRSATALAIQANLEFFPWDGGFVQFDEGLYRLAVAPERGDTACLDAARAMETAWKRPPFILAGKRLYVDAWLLWDGEERRVTSFQSPKEEEGEAVAIVCSYRERDPAKYSPDKIASRHRVTVADLKAAEKAGGVAWLETYPKLYHRHGEE